MDMAEFCLSLDPESYKAEVAMGRNSKGILVRHEDGRKGILYSRDQKETFTKEKKAVVQFVDKDMKPTGKKRSVLSEKLTQIGFID